MRRVSSVGDGRPAACPAGFWHAGGKFPNECRNVSPANRRFPRDEGDAATENAPAEIPELQALSSVDARISTMRAPVPKEAWPAVERGPYLLGFSQWAGDGQNRRHTSNAQRVTSKRPHLQALYGANRDRTGDLLLAN